jgi:hypothetical protein
MAWLSLFTLSGLAAARSHVSFLQPLQALLLPVAGAAAMLGADALIGLDVSPLLRLLILPPVLLVVYLGVVGMLGFATEARVVVHLRNAHARWRAAR